MITPHPHLEVNVAEKLAGSIVAAAHQYLRISSEPMNHGRQSAASAFFNNLLSCSLSRGGAQFFTPPPRTAPIVGAHSRRQDPKTPVEQALMRGLGTA